MKLNVGQVLNQRYRIIKLLGEGGFGAVYRAWDQNLNIPCALKENFEGSPEAARQFSREAQILASLRHPNLPKVTDHFTLPGQGQYLVMEFVDGEDLEEKRVKYAGRLPESDVFAWADQVLTALEYLHSHEPPIIHRDIKPANIRITPSGQAMLVDFGIAKVYDPTMKTTVGARAITPGYSPVEQYGGGSTDQRSDIYAFGATLYSLLSGKVPPESITRTFNDPLGSLENLATGISSELNSVIGKAIQVDPARRWQSAAEMRGALKSAQDNSTTERVRPVLVAPPAAAGSMQFHQQPQREPAVLPTEFVPQQAAARATHPPMNPASEKTTKSPVIPILVGAGVLGILVLIIIEMGSYLVMNKKDPTSTPTRLAAVAAPSTKAVVQVPAAGAIKIGLLSPMSGAVPTFGQSTKEGAELAVKEWNDRGGVLGRKLELIVADSQCEADPAINAANKLIDQDGVKFIVGEVCSKASIPVAEIVNQKSVLQISPTSTNTAVTIDLDGNTRKFTFRACFIDPFQGLVMAKFARGKGFNTAFIMFDQGNDYVRGLAEAFEESFIQMGGQIVGKETYISSDTDFSAILTKVAASKAEVLYLPDYYNIVNLVGAQAKDKGVTSVMMGGDGWDSPDLNLSAADGGFYSNHYDPGDTRPIVQDWLKIYGSAYKDTLGNPKVPDALATLAYDSTNILIAAIQKAASDDPAYVAAALAGSSWNGVSGAITFDAQHNPIKAAAVIGISGGRKTFVQSVAP